MIIVTILIVLLINQAKLIGFRLWVDENGQFKIRNQPKRWFPNMIAINWTLRFLFGSFVLKRDHKTPPVLAENVAFKRFVSKWGFQTFCAIVALFSSQ